MKLFLRYWAPLFIWMALIFMGSTDLLSAEHTSRFIAPFLRWLHPGISPLAMVRIQTLIRKAGHVTEYAVLALLMFRALAQTALSRRVLLAMALALLACGAFAASDEFHQAFIPSRTASVRDVLIDVAGAGLGIALYAGTWRTFGSFARRKRWA